MQTSRVEVPASLFAQAVAFVEGLLGPLVTSLSLVASSLHSGQGAVSARLEITARSWGLQLTPQARCWRPPS